MKLEQGKKYEIKWVDTFGRSGWWSEDEIKEKAQKNNSRIKTVGFFVGRYHGFVCLCLSLDFEENNFYGHPNWIPTNCIKEVRELK